MTIQDKLEEQLRCAILATLGDLADKELDSEEDDDIRNYVNRADLNEIARKTAWYLDM